MNTTMEMVRLIDRMRLMPALGDVVATWGDVATAVETFTADPRRDNSLKLLRALQAHGHSITRMNAAIGAL